MAPDNCYQHFGNAYVQDQTFGKGGVRVITNLYSSAITIDGHSYMQLLTNLTEKFK